MIALRFKIRMTSVADQVEPVEEPVREPETAFPQQTDRKQR